MIRRKTYLGLAGLAILGLAAGYAIHKTAESGVETAVPAEQDCDSCSARKKDMARMRERLNPPEAAQE